MYKRQGKDNAEASKAAAAKLVPALEKAVAECGSCGCEFDELYKDCLLYTSAAIRSGNASG